jgi:hypothetical protein
VQPWSITQKACKSFDLQALNNRGDKTPVELFVRFCAEIKDFDFGALETLKLTLQKNSGMNCPMT